MSPEQLKQLEAELTEAGMRYDGHATNGSIAEQIKVIQKYLTIQAGHSYNLGFRDGEVHGH